MISESPAQAGDFHLSKNFYFLRVFLISASIAAQTFHSACGDAAGGFSRGRLFGSAP